MRLICHGCVIVLGVDSKIHGQILTKLSFLPQNTDTK